MLILNKEKENLLVEEYGFQAERSFDGGIYYLTKNGRLTIYGASYQGKNRLKVKANSLSVEVQNILYKLIKDEVLLCVKETESISEIVKLKNHIKELEDRIKELEGNNEKR